MKINARIAAEVLQHEGATLEAYKDVVHVWTWGVGMAETGGYDVLQYKDNPQPLSVVLRAFVDALENDYAPAVRAALPGNLTEAQFAAALSFHYNTGAVARASWVKHWNAGDAKAAKKAFMNWSKPKQIIPRRKAERDLFFSGKWTAKPTGTIWGVKKPRYIPDWNDATKFNALAELDAILSSPRSPALKEQPGGFGAILAGIISAVFGRKS